MAFDRIISIVLPSEQLPMYQEESELTLRCIEEYGAALSGIPEGMVIGKAESAFLLLKKVFH